MPLTPKPRRGVLDISPYVGGASNAPGASRVFKLSSNESPLGPSPRATDAIKQAADALHLYPDGESTALREEIAKHFELDAGRIVCGNGSGEILGLLAQCYLEPGDETLHSEHGFSLFHIITLTNGGAPITVPEKDLRTDINAILERITPRTRIVFLANPNNPTGTYLPPAELQKLHEQLPGNVVLVLDAAYAEYVTEDDYDAGAILARKAENVVMTRTFSKIYGIAAMRLGWGYCPLAIADVLNRVRHPFNISAPAQAAGIAALRDQAFFDEAVAHNTKWRAWITDEIKKLGLKVTPSVTNFLLIHFPETPEHSANNALAFLLRKGLILRSTKNYNLPNALRVSVGTEEANRALIQALAAFMNQEATRNG